MKTVTRHVVTEDVYLPDIFSDIYAFNDVQPTYFTEGTIYYLNENSMLHNDNGPALILTGTALYWKNNAGQMCQKREIEPTPALFWCKNGNIHREDGPAVIWSSGEIWRQNNLKHRLNGPAVIQHNGSVEWYIKNEKIVNVTQDDYKWLILKGDPESIKAFPKGANKDMQEYLFKTRPDLISYVQNIDPELAQKYSHELQISKTDI